MGEQARFPLYAQNVDGHFSPICDRSDAWLATMEYTGSEGGCWVVGCATCLQAVDVQNTQPYRHELFPETEEWENPGDAGVYRPLGTLHAGLMRKEKDCRWRRSISIPQHRSQRKFDVRGHHSRRDVFRLHVSRAKRTPISFDQAGASAMRCPLRAQPRRQVWPSFTIGANVRSDELQRSVGICVVWRDWADPGGWSDKGKGPNCPHVGP